MKKPAKDEVDQRRAEVEAELAARKKEREEAWAAMERKKQEDAARRASQGPDPEMAEAVRRARERAERERRELFRASFEKEAAKRNPNAPLEERLREEHAEDHERHLACWARLQDSMQGTDEIEKREALKAMAHAWREREDLLVRVATSAAKPKGKSKAGKAKGAKAKKIDVPNAAESLKAKLATLTEQREAAIQSIQKKVRRKKKKKAAE